MKTSELIGPALDWAVAKAQGWTDYPTDSIEQGSKWHCDPENTPFGRVMWKDHFTPSTNWAQGGPIIEREGLGLRVHCTENGKITSWASELEWPMTPDKGACGPTPLVAAMRCFVASKLGDEVEIPEELC